MTRDAVINLKKDAVGTLHIVAFVVAAAAPLTAVIGASPAAFAYGNGAGVPGAFLIAGLLYSIFGAAFTAMSRYGGSAGGFYGYIARGMGRRASVCGAFIAVAAYSAIQIAIYSLLGLFTAQRLAAYGVIIPWWGVALAAALLVHLCGRRGLEFSGMVLGILMALEVLVLVALDAGIIADRGAAGGFSATGLTPGVLFGPGLGATLVFVVASYVGFEATTIFSEEAVDPERTVPRATFYAVTIITLLYAFSTWSISQAYGDDHIAAAAAADPSNLYFGVAQRLFGETPRLIMETLLLTSLFASLLAFHNTIARYIFALSRDRLLLPALGQVDRRGSPGLAAKVQSLTAMALIGFFALLEADPYAVVFSWLSAFATIGILAVQLMVAISVWRFFRGDACGVGLFRRAVAPALSGLGIATCLVLVCFNLKLLSGSSSNAILFFPLIIAGIGVVGVAAAVRMRRRRPTDYARLGELLGQMG